MAAGFFSKSDRILRENSILLMDILYFIMGLGSSVLVDF